MYISVYTYICVCVCVRVCVIRARPPLHPLCLPTPVARVNLAGDGNFKALITEPAGGGQAAGS